LIVSTGSEWIFKAKGACTGEEALNRCNKFERNLLTPLAELAKDFLDDELLWQFLTTPCRAPSNQ